MQVAARTGAATLRQENYIPGFDWVRLFGSILVVVSHCGFFDFFKSSFYSVYLLFNGIVPVFFLMAGYLIAERLGDRGYVLGYLKKYALLYLGASMLRILPHAASGLFLRGDFSLRELLTVLALLPFKNVYVSAFWFLPALIYGVAVNALLRSRPGALNAVCVLCAAVMVAHALSGCLTVQYPARNIAKGIVYLRLGILRRERRLPLWPVAAALAVLGPFELLVRYLDLAVIALSLLTFEGVLRLKGGFLHPRHLQISIFSMLNYFLHPFWQVLLGYFTDLGKVPVLLIILAVNTLLTPLLCACIQKTKQRKQDDGL